MPRRNIRTVYKEFNLPYDVRAARKLLNEPKDMPRKKVNKKLNKLYTSILMDSCPPVFLYTLKGTTQQEYEVQGKKDVSFKLSKPEPIDMTFQSVDRYNIRPVAVVGVESMELKGSKKRPIAYFEGDADKYLGSEGILKQWMECGQGPAHYKVNILISVSVRKICSVDKKLNNIPLFAAPVKLPYKEFNGFKDSGTFQCVPETLLHHLQLNNRNKKLTLRKVKDVLDNVEEDRDAKYNEEYILDGEPESIDEGNRGYTPEEIILTLEQYNCRARLLDVNLKEFLTTDKQLKIDKHLNVFVGIVYANHLYYCDNSSLVASIGGRNKSKKGFDKHVYEKKKESQEDTRVYNIIETNDLLDIYKELFNQDNTIRKVKTENGRITRLELGDTVYCANHEKPIMEAILGKEFKNENTTMLGEREFKEFFPNHLKSEFNKDVFDNLQKHTGIVECFNVPLEEFQHEYDINKCRTDCWMNNRLGSWEVYGVHCDIHDYDGQIKKGQYFIETEDREFFMKGNGWYSGDYLLYALKEEVEFKISYQLLASSTLKPDYFKHFVWKLIKKYPMLVKGKPVYKKIVNSCVGYRGKTRSVERKGYVETDFDLAVAAFFDNNKQRIGFMHDKKNIDKHLWKMMTGELCNISSLRMNQDVEHYCVETTTMKTMYENDMPIYNKVLENEFLRIYELKKALSPCRIIKIKTDAIIVEGKHTELPSKPNKIGAIKRSKVKVENVCFKDKDPLVLDIETSLNWNVFTEQEDRSFLELPKGSFLVTGLAGFGKSYYVKQLEEYPLDTTIRLGFTNVSCENLSDEEHAAFTLSSYFGIDFTTKKVSEKKLQLLKDVECIMITEVFMTPSYIMGFLLKVKNAYPHIKFICEGDPEQTRPVKEEHINWLTTKLLYTLCDANLVQLTVNKRNDETKNYQRILKGETLECVGERAPTRISICRTNKMREAINRERMKEDMKKGYFLKKDKALNIKSQDVFLTLDTPIMCVKTDKKLEIRNGQMLKIEKMEKNKITIKEKEYTDKAFTEFFVVAFACTNHKVQGITIKAEFNIYEWELMTFRERYTAYSRTSDGSNVQIIMKVNFEVEEEAFNYCIYKWSCKNDDCNHFYIGSAKSFVKRKAEHLRALKKGVEYDLYQCMRENGGAKEWTMEVVEEFEAATRAQALKVEQKWIEELEPSLNMIEALK